LIKRKTGAQGTEEKASYLMHYFYTDNISVIIKRKAN
jgi:hypothetical protein